MSIKDVLDELFLRQEISLEQYLKYNESCPSIEQLENKYNQLIDNQN